MPQLGDLVRDHGVDGQETGSPVVFGDLLADCGGVFEIGEDLV